MTPERNVSKIPSKKPVTKKIIENTIFDPKTSGYRTIRSNPKKDVEKNKPDPEGPASETDSLPTDQETLSQPGDEIRDRTATCLTFLVLSGLLPFCGWRVSKMRFRPRGYLGPLLGLSCYSDTQVQRRNRAPDSNSIRKSVRR